MSSTGTTKRMDRQSIEFTGNVFCHSPNNAKEKEEALRTKVLNAMPSSGATDDNSAATTQMAQSEAALILPRVRSKWLKIYRDELGRNGHRQKRDHSAIHDESMLQQFLGFSMAMLNNQRVYDILSIIPVKSSELSRNASTNPQEF